MDDINFGTFNSLYDLFTAFHESSCIVFLKINFAWGLSLTISQRQKYMLWR